MELDGGSAWQSGSWGGDGRPGNKGTEDGEGDDKIQMLTNYTSFISIHIQFLFNVLFCN